MLSQPAVSPLLGRTATKQWYQRCVCLPSNHETNVGIWRCVRIDLNGFLHPNLSTEGVSSDSTVHRVSAAVGFRSWKWFFCNTRRRTPPGKSCSTNSSFQHGKRTSVNTSPDLERIEKSHHFSLCHASGGKVNKLCLKDDYRIIDLSFCLSTLPHHNRSLNHGCHKLSFWVWFKTPRFIYSLVYWEKHKHLLKSQILLFRSKLCQDKYLCFLSLQVSVVGIIRAYAPFVTNIQYSVDDMTGPCLSVRQWVNPEERIF